MVLLMADNFKNMEVTVPADVVRKKLEQIIGDGENLNQQDYKIDIDFILKNKIVFEKQKESYLIYQFTPWFSFNNGIFVYYLYYLATISFASGQTIIDIHLKKSFQYFFIGCLVFFSLFSIYLMSVGDFFVLFYIIVMITAILLLKKEKKRFRNFILDLLNNL